MFTGHVDCSLNIWDIRSQKAVQTIGNEDILTSLANSSENTGSLHQIAFSSNGYQFATAWQGSCVVKLFDLRKTEQNFDPVDIILPPIEGADED